jgi:hypothetical protein
MNSFIGRPVTCRIIDSFAFGDLQTLIFRNGLVVNGASLVIYALVGAAIHKLHGSKISARAVQQQPTAAVADQQGGGH